MKIKDKYKEFLFKQDKKIDGILKNPDKKVAEGKILPNFIYGFFVYFRVSYFLNREIRTITEIINKNDTLGANLIDLQAEFNNNIIYIYQYVSDEMLAWNDEKVITHTKKFLWDNIYGHLINDGANGMFSDRLSIEAYKLKPTDLAEIRGYLQTDELRKVSIEIFPTYLGTPPKILKLAFISLGIFVVLVTILLSLLFIFLY
jgi:hypothetical protein